jgi:hypothetical protein
MRTKLPLLIVGAAAVIAVVAMLAARGGDQIVTRPRLERSMEQSFAQRYVAEAKVLGHSGVSTASLEPRAFCDKGGPGVPDEGPGSDWNCYLHWNDRNVPLPDGTGKFEMNVHSNGCYTAGGPSKLTGLATLTSTGGKTVDNPVYEWDACYDPGGAAAANPVAGTPASVSLPKGKIPIDQGTAGPELACSDGAVGGCIGTLTATLGGKTVASVNYQLAPKESNKFSFPLPNRDRALGTKLTLSAQPFLGKSAQPTSEVTLGPPTD